jgi:putative tryptophan/tyrosine transport system substrate-binding protein
VPAEIQRAIAELVEQRIGGFVTTSDILFSAQSAELAALADRNMLPAVYHEPDITQAGGLLSYGSNIADAYRLAGNYVGRILKGEKSGELPVQQAVKVGLVINLKAAKTLGLMIPEALLAIADEEIQ